MKGYKKAAAKLRGRETFIELLIAVLVVAFGCMIIATMFTAAMNGNIQAQKKDMDYYNAVSQMEEMTEGSDIQVTIEGEDGTTQVNGQKYGNDAYSAYRWK